MQLTVLIGFLYEESKLDSTYTDLYLMYKLCSNANGRIVTISDVSTIPSVVVNNIVTSKIDSGISSYNPSQSEWYTVKTLHDLKVAISDLELKLVDRLVIYYSGHCESGGFLRMPDNSLLQMVEFRDMILDITSSKTRVMFIMDCCHADHLNLSYNYNCNKERFEISTLDYPCRQDVMAIVSCDKDDVSVASYSSFFTRCLSEVLGQEKIHIGKIIEDVTSAIRYSGHQEVNKIKIQSSYYNDDVIWTWFYRKYEISLDRYNRCITVRHY